MEDFTSIKSALLDHLEPSQKHHSQCSITEKSPVVNGAKSPSSAKPPNICVYSECQSSADSIKNTLSLVLEKQRYTVYILNSTQMLTAPWLNNVCLLVIAGDVSPEIMSRLKSYVIDGNGRLLCFGSNMLGAFVSELSSAKIQDKMAAFTYSEWKRVEMIHRILKYQPSTTLENGLNSIKSHIPNKIKQFNSNNDPINFDVSTFGQEEESQTPSFILVASTNGGKALFANVHLEIEIDDQETTSNKLRTDIFVDLLRKHFSLVCGDECNSEPDYTVGFLFGETWRKKQFLKDLEGKLDCDGVLKLKKIGVKFCGNGVEVPEPSPTMLPVLVDGECEGFSVELFFDELKTKKMGRLGVFSKVMTSSMYVVDSRLVDGLMVVPYSLTRGVGRGENVWLSPEGCALFSLQVHVDSQSLFTRRLGFLQHCVTLAAVLCVRGLPGLDDLDVRLKWPNDIYADKTLKLGGAIASSIVTSRDAICNLGVGVNLFNRLPTTCINDMIDALNERKGTKVDHLTLEKFDALLLNQFEQLVDMVESGRIDEVIELYYKYWLHSGSRVCVRTEDGCERQVTIVGIDDSGFLRVMDKELRLFSVHPDGNSFDMLSGLIAPKVL